MQLTSLENVTEILSSMGYTLDLEVLNKPVREMEEKLEILAKGCRSSNEKLDSARTEARVAKVEQTRLQGLLDKAQEKNLQLERDLARALGYIDRVVEQETPPPEPVLIQEQRTLAARGPRLGSPVSDFCSDFRSR